MNSIRPHQAILIISFTFLFLSNIMFAQPQKGDNEIMFGGFYTHTIGLALDETPLPELYHVAGKAYGNRGNIVLSCNYGRYITDNISIGMKLVYTYSYENEYMMFFKDGVPGKKYAPPAVNEVMGITIGPKLEYSYLKDNMKTVPYFGLTPFLMYKKSTKKDPVFTDNLYACLIGDFGYKHYFTRYFSLFGELDLVYIFRRTSKEGGGMILLQCGFIYIF